MQTWLISWRSTLVLHNSSVQQLAVCSRLGVSVASADYASKCHHMLGCSTSNSVSFCSRLFLLHPCCHFNWCASCLVSACPVLLTQKHSAFALPPTSPSYPLPPSFSPDSQSEPQRHLSDQFPGRVQVHSWSDGFPEAGEVPGGHHLHREHQRHKGERHIFCHLHLALR